VTEDDEPEDPQLRSLRAVWLSLPDEEPPTRGLDALMAAARAKAEVLATPPWWKRLLQGLMRPPVLALASIMVLIGGAVLFSNHKRADEAMPTMKQPPSAEGAGAPPPAAATPPPAETGEGQAAPEADLKKARAEDPTPSKPDDKPKPVVVQPPPPHHGSPRSPDLATPKVEAATKATARPIGGETRPGFEANKDDSTADEVTAAKPDAPEPAQDGKATTRAPGRVMVDQLLVQCRSAATRGDCEAAKLIARRIASQDATYYREHVATDAAIQKCLGTP